MLLRLQFFLLKILNSDIVMRLEEESAHITVGIVSIVHLNTAAHRHTHAAHIPCICTNRNTDILLTV